MEHDSLVTVVISNMLDDKTSKYYSTINSFNLYDLMLCFDHLSNIIDLTVYEMVNKSEVIALPYIGRLHIKDGTANAVKVYTELFKEHNINSINDLKGSKKYELMEKFKESYKQYLNYVPKSHEEVSEIVNKNFAKYFGKSID